MSKQLLIECIFLSYTKLIHHLIKEIQGLMTKISRKKKKFLFSSLTLACFALCLLVANLLTTFIIPATAQAESICLPSQEIHLLSLGKSQVESEARARAKDFMPLGSGGYVWKLDNYYHIISSAYTNKNDAQLVQSNISINLAFESEIITLKLNQVSINGSFDSEEYKVVSNYLGATNHLYHSLFDIALSVETGVSSQVGAKLSVNSALNDFSTKMANFSTLFPNPNKELLPLHKHCQNVFKIGQKLAQNQTICQQQTYCSLIKYRYLEILNELYNLCNN